MLTKAAGAYKKSCSHTWGCVGEMQALVLNYGFKDVFYRKFLPCQVEKEHMTFVVTESCIKCKYTDCVDVCPVDCFREGPNMLVIDPEECIDCTLCVPECPVEAIFAEDDVPDTQQAFIALNAELSKQWKPIIERKDGPLDADDWAKIADKKGLLER